MILSIIIVNYNVEHFLHHCLKSLEKATKNIKSEIFVVDNNSIDNSVNMLQQSFPYVNLIINSENQGFSKANNLAIKKAKGKYILLLNPDTIIQEDTLTKTISFLNNNQDVGGLGVKMIDGKGSFLPESKRSLPTPSSAFYKIFGLSKLFPNSKTFGQYHLNYKDENEICEIDVISGAFFMTRKKIIEKIGMLDESFFMYGEDIDLSYRIQKAGYRNFYYPKTSIIHYKGESTKKTSVNYIFMFYKAMIIFVKKHYTNKKAKPLIFTIKIAIFLRAFISILKRFIIKLLMPTADFAIVFVGLYYLQKLWALKYFSTENYYNNNFLQFIIPLYIFCWLIGIYIQNGYKKPLRPIKIIKGVVVGTIIILITYGLLPENLRFSRALIIMGALWGVVSLNIFRFLINLFFNNNTTIKRIGVVAEKKEFERISKIIHNTHPNIKFIRQINVSKKTKKSLGNLNQLNEILKIHTLNELVFSAKDVKANEIMNNMSNLKSNLSIKISPSESTFIIGSNSIHTQGDLYILNNKTSQRKSIKRFFKKYIDFFN